MEEFGELATKSVYLRIYLLTIFQILEKKKTSQAITALYIPKQYNRQ